MWMNIENEDFRGGLKHFANVMRVCSLCYNLKHFEFSFSHEFSC